MTRIIRSFITEVKKRVSEDKELQELNKIFLIKAKEYARIKGYPEPLTVQDANKLVKIAKRRK